MPTCIPLPATSPSPGEALTDVGLTTLTLLTRTDLDRVRQA
jgi:hypothetical protein